MPGPYALFAVLLSLGLVQLTAADEFSGSLEGGHKTDVGKPLKEGDEIPRFWVTNGVLLSAINAFVGAVLTARLIHLTKLETCPKWYYTMVALSGLSLGVGCFWSTHFVGMGALRLGCDSDGVGQCVNMTFEVWMSVLSGLVPSAISSLGVHVIASSRDESTQEHVFRWSRIILSGVLTGTAVHAMHFLGMISQGGAFRMEWDFSVVVVCYILACVACVAAFFIMFKFERLPDWLDVPMQMAKGLVIGAAVCFVHYYGMSAAMYRYKEEPEAVSWSHWSHHSVHIGDFWITVVVTLFQLVLDLVLAVRERLYPEATRRSQAAALPPALKTKGQQEDERVLILAAGKDSRMEAGSCIELEQTF